MLPASRVFVPSPGNLGYNEKHMTISAVIIAHNEEKLIKRCIESLIYQTKVPDEIVLIAHNCTDGTAAIAKEYKNIRVVEHSTSESGAVFARMKGFEEAKGDIVACIDGDSMAFDSWIERITEPFEDPLVAGVGGFVLFNGFLATIWSLSFFFFDPLFRPTYRFYFWGSNFACRKALYSGIGGFSGLIPLKESIPLNYWAEDLYLSLALSRVGRVVFRPRAIVFSSSRIFKEDSPREKSRKQNEDRISLFSRFKTL